MFSAIPAVTVPELDDPLPDATCVLDVREQVEWDHGHIEGARPPADDGARSSDAARSRSARCSSCAGSVHGRRRSRRTSSSRAYDAVNLDGGMVDWAAAGRAMVSETGQPPQVV